MEPHYVVDAIEKGPFRAPTDEEWEALARGGETGRLSMFGDELPTAALLRSVLQKPLSRLNGFGLGGFGALPEVVSDAISPSELEGPRIVRGGAGLLLPWQDVGEWHLMLHAVRSSQRAAPTLAFRAVLGVRTDGSEPATVATKTRSSSAKAKPRR